jgi:hypothetical protein
MRFLSIYRAVEKASPPKPQEIERMGKLIEEEMRAGVLLATEGCLPSARGARVRIVDEQIIVTDGPFTETKEQVGGFALLQVNSKAEAIEAAKRFLKVVGQGETELRQIYEPGDFGS